MKIYLNYKREKEEIDDITETVRVIEKVAAARMKQLTSVINAVDGYASDLENIIQEFLKEETTINHPYFSVKEIPAREKTAIVLSSEKGLAGKINDNLTLYIGQQKFERLIVVGKDIAEKIRKRKMNIDYFFTSSDDFNVLYSELSQIFLKLYRGLETQIFVVYNKFDSFTEMNPISELLLPIVLKPLEDKKNENKGFPVFEPRKDVFIGTLLEKHLEISLLKAFQNAKLSEYAARTLSMESAEQRAQDESNKRQYLFLKTRNISKTLEQLETFIGHSI